jgi:gliding motility-associated lipoprotein GldH
MIFKKKQFSDVMIGLCFGLVVVACRPDGHFKEHQDIEDGLWYLKNEPSFTFEITDTTKTYQVYYLVRNAVQYPYYNLYLKRTLFDGQKKIMSEKLNELILMDEKTGKPLGDGLGDLFDHKIVMLKDQRFSQKGKYTIKIQQYMRQDPLPGIMSMGVSVETPEK